MADYASLQKLALSDKGHDEAVTVNQRALIDKILARYASDNTTLRELLQNADDANATLVKIHYMTLSSSPVPLDALATTPCKRLQVSNNGVPFRPEDWTRLKRIAEGNPDAEKIGAFGVGFYSVFSICDDPFVSSGKECMAFYWNDRDQLFVKRRELEKEEDKTTFMLNMRTPTEIPNLPEMCRFLATSLTFTRSLSSIELHFDDYKLLSLHRQGAPESSIPLNPSPISLISPKRSMQITSASLQPVQIKATYMNITQHIPTAPTTGFKKLFSRLAPPTPPPSLSATTTAIAFLRVATAQLSISIGPKFASEFERAQKKPPPRQTKLSLLCINKHEFDASTANDPLFAGLIPKTQGRVYIGFPTHQTTGFRGHVGAPALVPTVERESIDLADPQLRVWNGELLGCVGIFARVLYNAEMDSLGRRFKKDDETILAEAIHLMQLFTFNQTTPSNKVREFIEETFFSCVKDGTIPLLTNQGVKPSSVVRIAPREMPFLTTTPLLPETIALRAEEFVSRLREAEILKEVTWEDVKKELNSRTLTETHAVQFMKWLTQENLPFDQVRQLLSTAIVILGDEKLGKVVNLGAVTSFVVMGKIPIDGGLPPNVLPLELGKSFAYRELESFGWQELSVLEWIKYVCTTPPPSPEFDIEKSADFATAVLTTASRHWDSMSPGDRTAIISMLKEKKCMPTLKKGLLKPGETYFHNVKVLPDLPTVESMKGVKEKFLEQLGVRRVVALQLIFDRLGEGGDWSHIDGIKYLASVQNNLTSEEFQKLRVYPLCPSRTDKKRMVVNQLYEPNRDLEKLDLPILSWPAESWRPTSQEARFLYALGLNRYPSAVTIIQMAARPTITPEQRNRILDFFTTFYHTYEYNRTNISKISEPFLPSEPDKDGKVKLCRPSEIYSNHACRVLGFNILAHRFIPDASKLGVSSDPTPQAVEQALISKPPTNANEAREKFTYAAQRVGSLSKTQLANLSRAKIVPVTRKGITKHVAPYLCFIDTYQQKERIWEDIFDFVDFGDRANLFLEALGVRDRPDPSQIADQLAREPRRIYQAMDIGDYLKLLATLGANVTQLQRDSHLWARLRAAPFLVGLVMMKDDETGMRASATLARADEIVIVDEPRLGLIFKGDLIVAPERDDCETLYMALGSPHLSSLVKQKYRARGPPVINAATEALKKHIVERAGIFLTLPEAVSRLAKSSSYIADNLRVQSHESIVVERTLLFGRTRSTNTANVTAVLDPSKGLTLLVTDPTKVNFNQVAEAINSIVLTKSNRGTDLMFEMILKENLEFLRSRGFAVDRLLNRHLEEKRLAKAKQEAEEAERRKEEKLRLARDKEERERQEAVRQAEEIMRPHAPVVNGVAANTSLANGHIEEKGKNRAQTSSPLPGAWQEPEVDGPPPPYPDHPQPQRPQQFPQHPLGGFVNSIRNAFKLPDPLLPDQPSSHQTPTVQPPQEIGSNPRYPTSKAAVDNQLASAVRASRPSDSTSIFHPATSSMVHEAPQSYCDSTEAQDLQLYAAAPKWGLKTFHVTNARGELESILAARQVDVEVFAELLKQLAIVYGVRQDSLHLFYDFRGKTIAFNRQGSLFFNISYFLELHVKESGGYTKDAPAYWFTCMAHELAHNMVHPHGAEHSYWTEAFISTYMLALWRHFG